MEELVDSLSLSLTSVLVAGVQTAGLEKGVQSTQAMNAEQRESFSAAKGSSCVAVSLTAAHVCRDADYHLMWPARLGSGSYLEMGGPQSTEVKSRKGVSSGP
ncbi:hypothetical protein AAC387_Pa03g2228 [Persea americana]